VKPNKLTNYTQGQEYTDNTGDLARSTPKANVCDWQWFAAVPVVERTIDMTIDMRTIAMLACGVV